jgi:hypothetical protein
MHSKMPVPNKLSALLRNFNPGHLGDKARTELLPREPGDLPDRRADVSSLESVRSYRPPPTSNGEWITYGMISGLCGAKTRGYSMGLMITMIAVNGSDAQVASTFQAAGHRGNNFDLIRLLAAAQVAIVHTSEALGVFNPAVTMWLGLLPGVPIFFSYKAF